MTMTIYLVWKLLFTVGMKIIIQADAAFQILKASPARIIIITLLFISRCSRGGKCRKGKKLWPGVDRIPISANSISIFAPLTRIFGTFYPPSPRSSPDRLEYNVARAKRGSRNKNSRPRHRFSLPPEVQK